MVGVPHSTGCALCRERHIKCDETVPECTQCQRYGRTCPGYRRTFRFQDEGPTLAMRHRGPRQRGRSARRARASGTTSTAAASSAQIEPIEPATPSSEYGGAASVVREHAVALIKRHKALTALDESVSPSLVRKSFKAAQPQLFLDFISASFPTLYFHNRFRAGNEPGFAENIIMNFGMDSFLDSAICCLSSVYLAHLTQDQALLKTSRHMYAMSLGEVIRALSKPKHATSDNMLCTAMMLSVYEMYAQTTPDAWVVHSDGVKRLMISRGTALHESGFGRSCWIAFRGFLIATAVYEGKPCFLDEDEWQRFASKVKVEDAQKPGEWSDYADISDLAFMEITKCPRYLSEAREVLSGTAETNQAAITDLINRIQDTSTRLSALSIELRACIGSHNQRQQGIVQRPASFVGPVPEIFPDTGPSLLLRGAENILETLDQLRDRLDDRLRCRVIEELSPESLVDTPGSEGSVNSASQPSAASSPGPLTLPFRIHSELGRGPSGTSDRNDPRAVIWLDRVASSMGVLGTRVLPVEEGSSGSVDAGGSPETSSSY
ncbi:hypothetical protein NUU61_002745 [Penicillium alfredii]|uniref:Zn(2)-C6 fungal-type domain-containing protein n=1 Tax=Penicillium alfredii TaxID=1506179 RepID=A0A9W9FS67_9EURO|nr:uncharacterized protein NUU61_002745 [Penicillium alfredii]KAJ5105398.1 hypothetical protein NUU61_002745 [Penicillium alfredii]